MGELRLPLLLSYWLRRAREDEGPVGGWRSGEGGRIGSGPEKRLSGLIEGPLAELILAALRPRPRGPDGAPDGESPTEGILLSLP